MSMTSTQQVERLQALLDKVKQNRSAAREAPASAPMAAAPAPAAAQRAPAPAPAAAPSPAPSPTARKPGQGPTTPVGMPTPARRAPVIEDELDFSSLPPPGASRTPVQEPAFTPAERRARPGATPLEMAVEDTLDRPAVSPVLPQQPARAPAPAVQQPVAAAAPAPAQRRDGVVLADPTPPTPARPIAQTLSKQPPVVPVSFGDLLKRSLSLRPR